MKQYLELVEKILTDGEKRGDRTGTGTIGIFGHQMRFDLSYGFPLVGTKSTFFKGVKHEMCWMVRGGTNIIELQNAGVRIWDEWADEFGDLGPVYGAQWRAWRRNADDNDNCIDQLGELIEGLRTDPWSRRHVLTAWNPVDLPEPGLSPQENAAKGKMALAPCHCLAQFYVKELTEQQRRDWYDAFVGGLEHDMESQGYTEDVAAEFMDHSGVPSRSLSCQLYQRSCDVFLGLPFNIAGYAMLTHMIAHLLDYDVGEFVWTGGDTHLYQNHLEQAKELVTRTPGVMPTLRIRGTGQKKIEDFVPDDFQLFNYNPQPPIKAPVSV